MGKFDNYPSISLLEFLTDYLMLDIPRSTLKKLGRLTHKDIKEFHIPCIKTIPFDNVEKSDLYEGKVLLVYDGKNRIAPYIRPELLKEEEKRRGLC